MAGLLYKDFVSIKGKYWSAALLMLTLLLTVVTFADQDGLLAPLSSSLIVTISIFLLLFISYSVEMDVLTIDESRSSQNYMLSLPVSKSDYIASKYWFLLITYYVVLSFNQFWSMIFLAPSPEETFYNLVAATASLMPTIVCCFMILSALELPFFLMLGAEKGKYVKITAIILFFFLMVAFLLFGDLTLLDYLDLTLLIDYLETHIEVIFGLQVFFPIVSLLLYCGSFLLTCKLYEGKEGAIHE